jgi:hypothetical protein
MAAGPAACGAEVFTMPRAAMVVGFSILVVAVVAALLWRDDGPPPTLAVAPAAAEAAAPAATPAAAPTAPAEAPAPGVALERAAVDVAAVAADATTPLPDPPLWLPVRIVDAASKQPVPGAEVVWSCGPARQRAMALPQEARDALLPDAEALARRFGWRTTADGTGMARIAADADGALVVATAAGRYGMRYLASNAPPGGHEVALEPDCSVHVLVRDGHGVPVAGIGIEGGRLDADGKRPMGSTGVPARTTDAEGRAMFSHTQTWGAHSGRGGSRSGADLPAFVRLEVPGLDVRATFDPRSPPPTPLELELPGTGTLLVSLRHDGRLLTAGLSASVWRGAADDWQEMNRSKQFSPGPDGVVRIERVALGGELLVAARVDHATVTTKVAAPRGNGEVVRVELTTDGHYVLSGRLRGPDGAWLASTTVQTQYDVEIRSGDGSVTSDGDGRFVWIVGKGWQDTAALRRLVFSRQVDGGSPLRAVVGTRELKRGTTDLGVVQLVAGPLVVAGRFVVAGALRPDRVSFAVQVDTGHRARDGSASWENVEMLAKAQRRDGTFEVRGEVPAGRLRLFFAGTQCLPIAPIEFTAGRADLAIPIEPGHALTATVLAEDSLPPRSLRARLAPRFAPPAEPPSESWLRGPGAWSRYEVEARRVDTGLQLKWQALPAGTYDLVVLVAGAAEPVVAIDGVVMPQPEGGDARLAGIDVRGLLRALRLDVTVPSPASAPTAGDVQRTTVYAFPQPQADAMAWTGTQVGGDLPLWLPVSVREVLVAAQGYAPRLVAVPTAGDRLAVSLEAWPTQHLVFADLPALPLGVVLQVGVMPAERETTQVRFQAGGNGGLLSNLTQPMVGLVKVVDGRAAVPIRDGSFRLWGHLTGEGKQRGVAVQGFEPTTLTGGPAPPPVTVRVPAAAIEAALAKLQQQAK